MIIWGSKAKEHQVGTGQFFCPNCVSDATYAHIRVSRYFTLYFIPLFATSTLGEYIRCKTCGATMKETVLRMSREQILRATQPWNCAQCNNRNPASEAVCLACGTARPSQPPPPLPAAPPPPAALPPVDSPPY